MKPATNVRVAERKKVIDRVHAISLFATPFEMLNAIFSANFHSDEFA